MRINLSKYFNLILLIIFIFTIITISILLQNIHDENINDESFIISRIKRTYSHNSNENSVDCSLVTHNNKRFKCFKTNNQIYIPFELIRKQFDLTLNESSNSKYNIYFTTGQIYAPPVKQHRPTCEYLWFAKIDVETRERVKHLNLKESVPVSSQWNPNGHVYAVQVGQYGLSHFSKWCLQKPRTNLTKFFVKQNVKFVYQDNENALVDQTTLGFKFKFSTKAIYKTNYSSIDMRYLVADLKTSSFIQLTCDLMLRDKTLSNGNYLVRLIYYFEPNDEVNSSGELIESVQLEDKTYQVVYYSKSSRIRASFRFVRNFCLDACKGLKLKCDDCLKQTSNYYKLYQISLKGEGLIENATFRSLEQSPHFEMAKQASDYLVHAQNKITGGWPISVMRKFDKNAKIFLKPDWHSAMAQGHAISLLCRVYSQSKEEKYLISASKALNVYDLDASENGVRSYLMNSVNNTWYEEYPTQPNGLYVLNGFIYSLFGLYDFIHVCHNENEKDLNSFNQIYFVKAKQLYMNGLKSLVKNINLFDTGTRSFYDLRHLLDASVYPNTARWDYHVLHVSQLNYLISMNLNSSLLINETNLDLSKLGDVAQRWLGYTRGKWNVNSQVKN